MARTCARTERRPTRSAFVPKYLDQTGKRLRETSDDTRARSSRRWASTRHRTSAADDALRALRDDAERARADRAGAASSSRATIGARTARACIRVAAKRRGEWHARAHARDRVSVVPSGDGATGVAPICAFRCRPIFRSATIDVRLTITVDGDASDERAALIVVPVALRVAARRARRPPRVRPDREPLHRSQRRELGRRRLHRSRRARAVGRRRSARTSSA